MSVLYDYIATSLCLSNNRIQEEQKLFLRINLHINAHKGIETIFADWTPFKQKITFYDIRGG